MSEVTGLFLRSRPEAVALPEYQLLFLPHTADMNNNTHLSSDGFTLPELALVLLITALLAGGGGLFWQGWREQQQLAETATGLQVFLAGVREVANRTNRHLPLAIYRSGDIWCVDTRPQAERNGCLRTARFVWRAPYPQIQLLAVLGEPGFYGRRNVARAGSLEFGTPVRRMRVIISSRARIRLCQPAAGGCE